MEHKVLAIITEEELNQLLENNNRRKASLEMLDKIQGQIAREYSINEKLYKTIRKKYGISEQEIHLNMISREIREGLADA